MTGLHGILDDGCVLYVENLFPYIQFTQELMSFFMIQAFEGIFMEAGDIPDMAQPVVDQSVITVFHGRVDTPATVVTTDNDVFYPQDFDRKLDHGQAVQIRVHYDIGDIAMYENLSGRKIDDLVGRDAAVRAADPEILGFLLAGQAGEKFRVRFRDGRCPLQISVKQVFQRFQFQVRLSSLPGNIT